MKALALTHLLLIALALPFVSKAEERRAFLEKQDLFVAGEHGYKLYHIPGLLVTSKGTILAWCEARENGGDWDKIDLLMRRSEDEGETWQPHVNVTVVPDDVKMNDASPKAKEGDADAITVNNPVLIADRDGSIHFVYCIEYARAFYRKSTDDGLSWSDPVEITSAFRDFDYDAKVIATGPNHGIQLRSGRLLIPVWISTGEGRGAHRPSVTATIFSDDGGETWQAGEIAVPNDESHTLNPNETTAVELADGRVMLNVRNESSHHRRIVVTSPDGATNWSEPRFDEALLEPVCMGSIIRHSLAKGDDGRNRILFSNPHNLFTKQGESVDGEIVGGGPKAERRNMAIKLSYDEGQSWSYHKVLEEGSGMYSDLAVTPSGSILCFYGRRLSDEGTTFAGDRLTVAKFNLTWLTEGGDTGN